MSPLTFNDLWANLVLTGFEYKRFQSLDLVLRLFAFSTKIFETYSEFKQEFVFF